MTGIRDICALNLCVWTSAGFYSRARPTSIFLGSRARFAPSQGSLARGGGAAPPQQFLVLAFAPGFLDMRRGAMSLHGPGSVSSADRPLPGPGSVRFDAYQISGASSVGFAAIAHISLAALLSIGARFLLLAALVSLRARKLARADMREAGGAAGAPPLPLQRATASRAFSFYCVF